MKRTTKRLKDMGFRGVMLCYAKEIVLNEKESSALISSCEGATSQSTIETEILPWKKGTLETLAMAEPGDFVAMK